MCLNTFWDHLVISSDKLAPNRGGRPKEAKGLNQNDYGVQNCFAIACCSVVAESIFLFCRSGHQRCIYRSNVFSFLAHYEAANTCQQCSQSYELHTRADSSEFLNWCDWSAFKEQSFLFMRCRLSALWRRLSTPMSLNLPAGLASGHTLRLIWCQKLALYLRVSDSRRRKTF